jgi:hypothetical protein
MASNAVSVEGNSRRSEDEIAAIGGREAVPGPVFRYLGEVVEATEKGWQLSLLEAHRAAELAGRRCSR